MDADDITQEVMIRLWENIETFNILASAAWIMKTTHNLCLDYLRKRQRSFSRETEITEEVEQLLKDEGKLSNPFIAVHNNMVNAQIKGAIQKLPENLRSVFVLYEIEEMKYGEISKALDIPLNSVKVYLLRARKKLQAELKNLQIQEQN